MTVTTWVFDRVIVVEVLDGDTIKVDIDLGFSIIRHALSVRLLGINARELHDPGGEEARVNLAELIPLGTLLRMTSVKDDKFGGRYDAILWHGQVGIAQTLIDTGWAAPWDGNGVKPVPPWPRPEEGVSRHARNPDRIAP